MRRVVTFYKFTQVARPAELRDRLQASAAALGLRGTVLIAEEGINGTLAAPPRLLEAFVSQLQAMPIFADMVCRWSAAAPGNPVFHRLKVRVKPEIVAFGEPDIDPAARSGERVDAGRWHDLLDDPEVVVVDTRNSYEIGIGRFPGAVDPGTGSFREFPGFVRDRLHPQRHPRVAMYCTGGIRCEKASAFLLARGFATVYQLDGGILHYLESVTSHDNRWQGDCFVFDQRVSVDANLAEARKPRPGAGESASRHGGSTIA